MMTKRPFPLIQTKPVPTGDEAWEAKRKAVIDKLVSKVPEEYYIPQKYVDNPPRDVTRIPGECGILSPKELDITENYDTVGLANAIAIRKYSAVEVATAFSKRAIICHQITCCLTQWFMDEALEQAKYLDDYLARTGKTIGPLHGVPVSIKEHIPLAGHPSTDGFLSGLVYDKSDAQMIKIVRDLGAVYYCKTNQPQSVMHLETDSIIGRVLNPFNINLSAGGSTGGEGALIALKGSVLGIGTDIGGSVRGPSGFCGIYGFKPTSYYLPIKDFVHGGFSAELNVLGCSGPMSRSLRDMDLFMSEVLGAKPYLEDPRLVPIPWTGLKTIIPRPLKVGIMMDDGVIQPQPPVTRALQWARSRLTSSLFEVKPFSPYRVAEAMRLIRLAYWPDGGKDVKESLAACGEPMHPLTQHIIADADGPELTALQITEMRVQRDEFRCAFIENWNAQDVDVVIAPVFVGPAAAHDTSFYWNYTALWNYVDHPAAVFPTPIKAERGEQYQSANMTALSEQCEHVRKLWTEEDFTGAPINLQIIARKYHDNLLFGALDLLKEPLELYST